MIVSFFIDNRIGGPHINFIKIAKTLKKRILYVTVGKSNFSNISLINLRFILKIFYPLEIFINIIQIIFLFKTKKCIFISNGIYNLAPIIAGSILRKKTYWYLLEEPNFINKITFKIVNFFFNFEILSISRKICEDYKIKKYRYFPPYVKIYNNKIKKVNKLKLKLVSIGNINKVKNHFFAVKTLSNYLPKFQYEIVGAKINTQKTLFENIYNFIKSNKLKKKIKLIGYRRQFEINKILSKNDIFLLPSLTEGCPISLLEAMSFGKICICSKVGDIPRIINNNHNGFLINLNERSLISILNKIRKTKSSELNRIQRNAQNTIRDLFSNKKFYKFLK